MLLPTKRYDITTLTYMYHKGRNMMYLIINNKMNIIYNTIIYRQWVEMYICVCIPACLSVYLSRCICVNRGIGSTTIGDIHTYMYHGEQ